MAGGLVTVIIFKLFDQMMKGFQKIFIVAVVTLLVSMVSACSGSVEINVPTCQSLEKCEGEMYSDDFMAAVNRNKQLAESSVAEDPSYFEKHTKGQSPKFLWIGCSDSRVTPEKILGVGIGQVFVHRNIANQVNLMDMSAMSVVQYAVKHLKVQTIIIAGHYECGGIKASLSNNDFGHLENWLSQIRDLRYDNEDYLKGLPSEEKVRKLIELNVAKQVENLSRVSVIQDTWRNGGTLEIIGAVYDIQSGLLKNIMKPVNGLHKIDEHKHFSSN